MQKIRDEFDRSTRRDSKRKDKRVTLERKAIRRQKFQTIELQAA
ncbi:hypothetical protein KGG70_gp06 [Streptomyces phage Celia]|uniref:Uncharacterized protein n=1 Tax=Streptomyces phage Celia TaxID=2590946 RepID=A0A516KRF5_9CAUD|nr:hypothetical protein KGG70_gp06 [Streptomyces phage Celia]QDP44278.1 hypothetical protein SEA_CELIA_75 [Streptomyces phage Celia]